MSICNINLKLNMFIWLYFFVFEMTNQNKCLARYLSRDTRIWAYSSFKMTNNHNEIAIF